MHTSCITGHFVTVLCNMLHPLLYIFEHVFEPLAGWNSAVLLPPLAKKGEILFAFLNAKNILTFIIVKILFVLILQSQGRSKKRKSLWKNSAFVLKPC